MPGSEIEFQTIEELLRVDRADCSYSTELVEVIGVVSHTGQSGWLTDHEYEVHCFEFAAWRKVGSHLVKSDLTILRPVQKASECFSDFFDGTIHHLRLLLSVDQTRAIFSGRVSSSVNDSELQAIATELEQPVTIDTMEFGKLTLNRQIKWYEGYTKWRGRKIEIHLETEGDGNVNPQLETAQQLMADEALWQDRIMSYAVDRLLETANRWDDDPGGNRITAPIFRKKIRLSSISISRKGGFEFWYSDGGMFGGHSISVRGSLSEGLFDAGISG